MEGLGEGRGDLVENADRDVLELVAAQRCEELGDPHDPYLSRHQCLLMDIGFLYCILNNYRSKKEKDPVIPKEEGWQMLSRWR